MEYATFSNISPSPPIKRRLAYTYELSASGGRQFTVKQISYKKLKNDILQS